MNEYEINIYDDIVNDKYKNFVFDDPKYKEYFIYGGAGAGKSYAVAQHLIIRCLTQDYFRCIYLRKVRNTVRNSQYQLFVDLIKQMNLEEFFTIRDTDMRITCNINGNSLIASGMDDTEKIKSIQDPTCVWLEEATEFTIDDYHQLRMRIRKEGVPIYSICTFNPVSTKSWLYSYLMRNLNNKDFYILKTNVDDNKYVNRHYVETLDKMKEYDTDLYNVYRLGNWGVGSADLIIKNYEVKDFVIDRYDCIGIDFGYVNPTAAVGIKVNTEKREIYVDELLYKTHLQVDDIAEQLEKYKDIPMYADSSEAATIDYLYFSKDFNIKKSNKDVRYGIRLLQTYKIFVSSKSVNLLNEIKEYRYMTDRYNNPIEQPVKSNDHLMDALRYALATYLGEILTNNNDIFFKTISKNG